MDLVRGAHHLTLSVGGAQEDYDFHARVLGLRSVKKTVLFDGELPVYHLYYGNGLGDASTLLTTFPYRQHGWKGRPGSNQAKTIKLTVPADSLNFWAERFDTLGIEYSDGRLFGTDRLFFRHPCGIEYALVGEREPDERAPWSGGGVPAEHAIRGAHGLTISAIDPREMVEFLTEGLGAKKLDSEGTTELFELGNTGHGKQIELVAEPDVMPATWRFGEGTVHHFAIDVNNPEDQQEVKDWLNGMGYTDVSERKDRRYFYSCYVRSPSGALFELAYSRPEGFLLDEVEDELGSSFQLPPHLENRRQELISQLEAIDTGAG
ncbi:MAG: ring-cleaving dioxygenase [Pseudonocardiaceae bacterium]|nr:ring-cleaving dioxygenase [Pseudonocardiaceae bacterium]